MKIVSILALGLFPLSLAINQPKYQCANFLKINAPQKQERGRYRRSWWSNDDKDERGSGDDFTTDSPVTPDPTTIVTTASPKPTTVAATATSAINTPDPTTVQATTTVRVTTSAEPSTTVKVTTSVNTPEPTTTVEATTERKTEPSGTTTESDKGFGATTTDATTEAPQDKAIIVMLDATGSMKHIGGRNKGRDVVVKKMETFRNMLNKKIQKDRVNDQPLTFVTFHESATWTSYNSISEWPSISKRNYNPGYQTNLYDSMGCVLSEYKSKNPNHQVSVYLISDGIHQLGPKKRANVAYQAEEINEMVESLRGVSNWNFHFYGATTDSKKAELKDEAINLGFRTAEIAVFDFNGKQFGSLLKSMLSTIVKGEKDEEDKVQVPVCEQCPKGPTGRMCRIRRKNQIAAGHCVKA